MKTVYNRIQYCEIIKANTKIWHDFSNHLFYLCCFSLPATNKDTFIPIQRDIINHIVHKTEVLQTLDIQTSKSLQSAATKKFKPTKGRIERYWYTANGHIKITQTKNGKKIKTKGYSVLAKNVLRPLQWWLYMNSIVHGFPRIAFHESHLEWGYIDISHQHK